MLCSYCIWMGILKSYFTEAAGIEVVVVMESMSRSQFGNDLAKAESFVKKQTPWHFISHGNSFFIVYDCFICICLHIAAFSFCN